MINNLHVCLVNSLRTLGGAELWFLDAARGLRERGIATSLVAQPGSVLLSRARDAGLPVAAIPIRCDGAPWTLGKLAWHFRRTGVTAVVCNLTKDLKAAGLAAWWAGVPVRLASRESDFPLKSKAYYRWYFGRVATGVLVNSEATRRTVLTSAPWLDPARVHLLHKGIDVHRFAPGDRDPAACEPVVGFVGQFIARKGLATLMTAWRQLEDETWTTPPTLRLAGDGPLRDDLVAWRGTLAHPERVELVGWTDDVAGFWQGCRCAVLPSHAEGFGLAAAEAAACGRPVVASRASSLPELVRHERTGILVDPDDPGALAAALGRLLRDGELSRTLGRAGRADTAARFARERTLDHLQALTCPEVFR